MTDDQRQLHREAIDLCDGFVAEVAPGDLDRATPCADWTLADLLAHLIGQNLGFARAVRDGDAPADAYAPVPFTVSAWRDSATAIVAAFAAADLDGTARVVELAPAPIPVRGLLAAQLFDTVVHTWDLARAFGRDFTPPEHLLQPVAAIAAGIRDEAYGPGRAFAERLPLTGATWDDALARVGRATT